MVRINEDDNTEREKDISSVFVDGMCEVSKRCHIAAERNR